MVRLEHSRCVVPLLVCQSVILNLGSTFPGLERRSLPSILWSAFVSILGPFVRGSCAPPRCPHSPTRAACGSVESESSRPLIHFPQSAVERGH